MTSYALSIHKEPQHADGRHEMPLLPMSQTSLIQKIQSRKLVVAELCKILALFPK